MRVTVIPEDKWVRKDNVAYNLPDWPFNDATIHAIQWHEDHGEIERNGTPKPQNEVITDASILQPYIEALDNYVAFLAEQEAQESEAQEASES